MNSIKQGFSTISQFHFQVSEYYNDYNVKGNDPTCKHEAYTDTASNSVSMPSFNRYCDSCGYRKLFIKYARFSPKRPKVNARWS